MLKFLEKLFGIFAIFKSLANLPVIEKVGGYGLCACFIGYFVQNIKR
jgi:hypothetical protein